MRYSMRSMFILTILICSIILTSCKGAESIKIDNKAVSENKKDQLMDTEKNNESNNVISPTTEHLKKTKKICK